MNHQKRARELLEAEKYHLVHKVTQLIDSGQIDEGIA